MTNIDSKQAELDDLHAWSRCVVEYFKTVTSKPLLTMVDLLGNAIEETHKRRNLKGLRQLAKDLLESASGLTSAQQAELDGILRSRTGRGLELGAKATRAEQETMARVLQRGSIKTDSEYRVLLDRVEHIYADHSRQTEVERLNELLRAYDEKSGQ